MRNLLLVAGLAGVVATAACGGDDRPDTVDGGGSGGSSGKTGKAPAAGKSGTAEGGAGGTGAEVDPLAPVVTITSPEAVDDPNQPGVLSGSEIEVVCTAKKSDGAGAEEVDSASIKLQLLDVQGELVEEKSGSPTNNEDEYSNSFIVTEYPAGALSFRCTAQDKDGDRAGEDEIRTLLDKGPLIEFVAPSTESYHPLLEPLTIQFTVQANPLGDDDQGAEVDSVTLQVGGKPYSLEGTEVSPGEYQVEVDLTDPLFTPPPNGPLALTVQATNKRQPSGIVGTNTQIVAIDGADPTIVITQPAMSAVVGNVVDLRFTVFDDVAGVDPESVVVTVNQHEEPFDRADEMRWSEDAGNFKFLFESGEIQGSVVQMTLTIVATDRVGNKSEVASRLLYLDHFPPKVDLDPLPIRTISRRSPEPDLCSMAFDPVGDEALNDEETVEIGSLVRLLVWEDTNYAAGFPQHFSTTDLTSVRIYVSKGSDALLEGKDGITTGPCADVVNPESLSAVQLDPLPLSSTPKYKPDDIDPPALGGQCVTQAETFPSLLCSGDSDMWHTIDRGYTRENGVLEPAIFGVEVDPSAADPECTGSTWEFNSKILADGWACLVGRAKDKAGNVGISRPLRVCIDSKVGPGQANYTPPCATQNPDPPPSCTNGCTPPDHWGNEKIIIQ